MKLALRQQVPAQYSQSQLQALFAAIETQGNLLAEGRLGGRHFTATSIPTTGDFAKGDIVWDSSPALTNGSVRLGWICTASGSPGTLKEIRTLVANFGQASAALGSDVSLNNTASYFTAPSVNVGTAGTWLVMGTVEVYDTSASARILTKLTDGTTVIASTESTTTAANNAVSISLSGIITNPAADLRISVRDATSTSGVVAANTTGNSKDSSITAIRIG